MVSQKITVLAENTAAGHDLLAEHGLSFWIEHENRKILFDTGQGQVIRRNARILGVSLEEVDCIVLSHGHYDHTGGLSVVLDSASNPRLYAHPLAFSSKYSRGRDSSVRDVGASEVNKSAAYSKAELILVNEPMEIAKGFWITGPIPRTNLYEDTGGEFFEDKDCRCLDELLDDQAAFIETPTGTVVILGCAHSGVINALHFIKKLTSNRPIRMVIGGMHLVNSSAERMEATIAELHRMEIAWLRPCHCTGFSAMARLWQEFPGRCEACPVGSVIKLS